MRKPEGPGRSGRSRSRSRSRPRDVDGRGPIRPAEDLAEVPDPAWPEWLELVRLAQVPVLVLPVARQAGLDVLFRLQVIARSMLGALDLHSGGMLADRGWVRLLGRGSGHLPDLATASGLRRPGASAPPPSLTAGFDVPGGRFAVSGGGLPARPGEVCHWGPDTLAWIALGTGCSQFAQTVPGGGLAGFYQDLRWPGWQDEVAAPGEDQGISVYPVLFTAESRPVAKAAAGPCRSPNCPARTPSWNGRRPARPPPRRPRSDCRRSSCQIRVAWRPGLRPGRIRRSGT